MSNKIQYGKWYLAGPMTGIPQFNFPLFGHVSAELRKDGFDVISPAEQDSSTVQTAALASPDGKLDAENKIGGETWGEILAKDVKIISDPELKGVIFLPNWTDSRGALLEVAVAFLCGKSFREWDEDLGACPISKYVVFGDWVAGFWRKAKEIA